MGVQDVTSQVIIQVLIQCLEGFAGVRAQISDLRFGAFLRRLTQHPLTQTVKHALSSLLHYRPNNRDSKPSWGTSIMRVTTS
jgi:hypothetical protein